MVRGRDEAVVDLVAHPDPVDQEQPVGTGLRPAEQMDLVVAAPERRALGRRRFGVALLGVALIGGSFFCVCCLFGLFGVFRRFRRKVVSLTHAYDCNSFCEWSVRPESMAKIEGLPRKDVVTTGCGAAW